MLGNRVTNIYRRAAKVCMLSGCCSYCWCAAGMSESACALGAGVRGVLSARKEGHLTPGILDPLGMLAWLFAAATENEMNQKQR